MKKLVFALFVAGAMAMGGVAEAGGGHGHHSGRGGYQQVGGRGHGGGYYRGGHRGGYRGGYRRSGWGWGWGGGVAIYPRVVIGGPGPYWWGNPYRYYYGAGYPYYGYGVPYPAPYYPQPIVVQPAQPQVYVQQQQQAPQYWYYCEDPKGYYPYVEKCRNEWLQVVPRNESVEPR